MSVGLLPWLPQPPQILLRSAAQFSMGSPSPVAVFRLLRLLRWTKTT
jgi:hypothetical protein